MSNRVSDLVYYREVYNHARRYADSLLVLNPGTGVPSEFYSLADMVVVFEGPLPYLYNSSSLSVASPKDCFLVYDVKTSQEADHLKEYLQSKGIGCVYMVDDNPPLWFRLSPYMEILLR